MNNTQLAQLVSRKKIILFDFDGVIKDSNSIKMNAFLDLFSDSTIEVKQAIMDHHRLNLGVSRIEKIPYYMRMASINVSAALIDQYVLRFSMLVTQKIIESDWIVGADNFIRRLSLTHRLYIVSATPKQELDIILRETCIADYFTDTYGSPTRKEDAISSILKNSGCSPSQAIYFGDGLTDYQAATKEGVSFVLVCNDDNKIVQESIRTAHRISNYL